VPLPDETTRLSILQVYGRKMHLHQSVDLTLLAKKTEGFSGAQLESLCNEASLFAFREFEQGQSKTQHYTDTISLANSIFVCDSHFDSALAVIGVMPLPPNAMPLL
jgi:ATP-dependent 26S proteasome regulatory subunit